MGAQKITIRVEGPTKKSVSDGMIESASMDIKYELKRAKNLYKKIRYEFHIFRFSTWHLTSWSGINRRTQPKAQEKEKTLLINKG